MPLMADTGLEVLDRTECFQLLATSRIGRVAVNVGALPTVLPVNFALDGEAVVFRTGPGRKLDAAVSGAVVAFEVDEVDAWYHEGWSVVVQGIAQRITDPDDLERLRRLPLRPWAPGPKDDYVRIAPTIVSGRRLSRHF
jgi:uncharacterized protein